MDFTHRAKRNRHFLLDENTQFVNCQKFKKDIGDKELINDNNNTLNYSSDDGNSSGSDSDENVDDYYDSYNWVDNVNENYKNQSNLDFLNANNANRHLFFNDDNDDNDVNNNYEDDTNDKDYDVNDDIQNNDSSGSDDSSSSDDSDEQQNKNNLQEEIYDLKKDIINNSGSYDHIEIALDDLKQIRTDYPKLKVSSIIKKFKEETQRLDDLNNSSGIQLFDDLYYKYKNAYKRVHTMVLKEYKKTKEKLNINKWATQKISERKKRFKKLKKTHNNDMIFTFLYPQPAANTSELNIPGWGGAVTKDNELVLEFEHLYKHDSSNKSATEYFRELETEQKKEYIVKLKNIKKLDGDLDNKPFMAKILECNTTDNNKSIILSKINTFENLKGSSEFYKLKSWITKMMKVPLGKYVVSPVTKDDGPEKIKEYLRGVRKNLDNDIYGHDVTKQQLIKILAHTIANPSEGGNIFALQGPPGVGKTALIQDGISKAMGRPFTFICLGGATDACFLEGHDYTYEGSNHGRIVELLQQAGCMNPVIYFDELDKVSDTPKGEEIINILMHITDTTQNSHFNDKYFGGIDFDLSKAIIIFSFNDEQKISRILRDRMKIIRVKGYKMLDKINIAKDYLLPKLIKHIGLNIDVRFSNDILEYIIDTYTNEGGVRKLKETLNDILLEINLRKLEDEKILNKKITDKITITKEMLEVDFLKKKYKIEHIKINSQPHIGQVNGLWANDYGIGGLIPIECCWIPAKEKLELELTGMQGKVMQESMSVARTIAWKILPNDIKEKLNSKWVKSFDYGIHIHCPDGSTPKDGPSAGGAITTCLISLLSGIPVNNKIAMTGEINLKGYITKIGGLEEKIFGAKKAGAELVLCPAENLKDLDEIREKFPKLFTDDFSVKTINNIWEILDLVLMNKIDYVNF
jgi:endopeptidase La